MSGLFLCRKVSQENIMADNLYKPEHRDTNIEVRVNYRLILSDLDKKWLRPEEHELHPNPYIQGQQIIEEGEK